ncbi:MAG: hypothetical protein KC434_19230, partial [Anaerolineales bacterium]|nr:hypothetical protein [Anaerolineales bacterium]
LPHNAQAYKSDFFVHVLLLWCERRNAEKKVCVVVWLWGNYAWGRNGRQAKWHHSLRLAL